MVVVMGVVMSDGSEADTRRAEVVVVMGVVTDDGDGCRDGRR